STMTTSTTCVGSAIDAYRFSTATRSNRFVARRRAVTSATVLGSTGAPTAMPASRRISSSLVATFPWTRISATVSWGEICSAATMTSAASTSGPRRPADAYLRLDVGLSIVVVLDRVPNIERADGERGSRVHVDGLWQPDVRKRLAHRHRRLDVVHADQPLTRKEAEIDVVERV